MNRLPANIKIPFQFNPLKHHLQYIKLFCSKSRYNFDEEEFKRKISKIGQNVTDIYTGVLQPEEIMNEIEEYLSNNNSFNYKDFHRLLNESGKDYLIFKLNDGSNWTLTLGDDKRNYIHIHPSRESPFVFRTRNNALKTAITMAVLFPAGVNYNLQMTNELRRKYLELPPLKNINNKSAIIKLFEILAAP